MLPHPPTSSTPGDLKQGLKKIVSEDTVRRSLRDADGKALDAWLSRHEHEVVDSMLRFAYVIDIDSTWKLARRCIFIRRPNVPKVPAIPLERAQLPAPDGAKPAPVTGSLAMRQYRNPLLPNLGLKSSNGFFSR